MAGSGSWVSCVARLKTTANKASIQLSRFGKLAPLASILLVLLYLKAVIPCSWGSDIRIRYVVLLKEKLKRKLSCGFPLRSIRTFRPVAVRPHQAGGLVAGAGW